MTVIDLSHTIRNGMPYYPGTLPPVLERVFTIASNGFAETRLDILSHIGTHMDAPAHLIAGQKTLDQCSPDTLIGKGLIISVPGSYGYLIQESLLQPYEKSIGQTDFIIFHTGWDQYWGSDQYFSAFPTLSPSAAEWLSRFHLKGIGIDTISFDPSESTDFPVHHCLLGKGILLAENLTNLKSIEKNPCMIAMLPLKFEAADGAPARIMAWYD